MLLRNLEHLETLDKLHTLKGRESSFGVFSIDLANRILSIRNYEQEIYRASFPVALPFTVSVQNLPGTITSNSAQSPDGRIKTSFTSFAGQGIQGGDQVSVFLSSSSSVLSS
ncbi:hypothetical protein [Stenomitos frigidus]|uniref:hypothetical protein n=1 Tax=Stenomitos frigidus TaxID=1886765 RepID=UPI000D081AC8